VTIGHDHEGRPIDFGRSAADYERHRPGFPGSFFDRLVRRGWIAPGMRALDLGTGTGSLALGMAARGLEVTGIDASAPMLEAARRIAARRGLEARFVEGRAEQTGLGASVFDVVTAGQCWWWFDEHEAVAEVRRVLSPRGRLLLCSFSYVVAPGGVAARTEDLILEHNPGWARAGWRGVHPEQIEMMDREGFGGVESFSYVEDVTFTHEGWRGRMRTCNGVGSALGEPSVERFDSDLADLLETEFPGPLPVPHRVFAVAGTLPAGR
jgi:SAM-dependent methyltransferase